MRAGATEVKIVCIADSIGDQFMKPTLCLSLALALLAGATLTHSPLSAQAAARHGCMAKVAEGTGSSHENAKFQAYEALLQATDWGAWATWMANGTTPGYKVNAVKYKCVTGGGLGVTCRGKTTICKF